MLGWGISDFFAKKSVDKIGDITALLWMQTLGLLPLILVFLFKFDLPAITPSLLLKLTALAAIDAAGYLFFYRALEKGKVSIVSPIVASYAAFSVLVSAVVFGESISTISALLLGLAFVGILLTSFDFKELKNDKLDKKDLIKGVPEAILSVVLFSFWFPFWDDFVSHGNWLFLLLGQRAVMASLLFLFTKVKKIPTKINSKEVWKWLFVIGGLDVFAYLALTWGYGKSNLTSVVSMLSAGFSLPTLIMARIFLKEKLKFVQQIGVVVILLTLILLAGFGSAH